MLWQKAVQCALVANVPALIEGDPGIGKTSFIYALGRALGAKPEVVIASLREPSDFLGLPIAADDGSVKMAPPLWAKRLAEAGENGMLVLDEITTAPPAVQAALLRVVLERVVGDLVLPPSVRVLAIANAAEQVNGWELSLPLANRFFHIHASAPEVKVWAVGLADGWQTPPEIPRLRWSREADSKAKALVGGFLSHRPSLMLSVPSNESKDRSAWPSPRSWENACKLLAVGMNEGDELIAAIVSGTIGPGGAKEFMSWLKTLDLPDPEYILSKPQKFQVPERIDKVFVILDSVSNLAVNLIGSQPIKEADDTWLRAWQVVQRVCDKDMTDVALVAAKKLAAARREGFTLPHKTLNQFRELLVGLE